MPYCYLLTATITELGLSEQWFWETEPKKVIAMLDEKREIDKEKQKQQAYYISCIMAGVDPDEKEKGIPGIDTPVSEEMLKGFY